MMLMIVLMLIMTCAHKQQERAHAQAEKVRARLEMEKMMQANKSLRDARAQAHEKELVSALYTQSITVAQVHSCPLCC
jgi:hypothetical protein